MDDGNIYIRKAERHDVPLLLEFIRRIARFGDMENLVIASAEVLEQELFDKHRAEAQFAVADGREVGFALYSNIFSTLFGHFVCIVRVTGTSGKAAQRIYPVGKA